MKNNKGFTIVEVIVVAVIVLILSAVAIPMYGSYITSARQGAVDNLAETAASAANNVWRRMSNADNPIGDAEIEKMIDDGELRIYTGDSDKPKEERKHIIEVRNEQICVRDRHHANINERCVSYRN